VVDDLGVAADEADRTLDAVHAGDAVDGGGVEAGGAPGAAIQFAVAADIGIRAGVCVREQAVERVVEGVREHERSGHEGDTEHDCECSGEEPQLLREQLLDGELEHDVLLILSRASAAEALDAVEHHVGCGIGHVVDDTTVGQEQRTVGV
jgi:hypothetical protein